MDREELVEMLRRGPVRVTMNDGSQCVIPKLGEKSLVSSLSVHSLYQDEKDGKWRFHVLPLVTMVRAEELESAA